MTKLELSILFGINETRVLEYIREAAKEMPSIKEKRKEIVGGYQINYTFDECVQIMSHMPCWNPMLKRYLREFYVDNSGGYWHENKKIKVTPSARVFIKDSLIARKNRSRCCNCEYLVAREFNRAHSKMYPYCTWYRVFLNKIPDKINIYGQRCPTYARSSRPALIWTSVGVYPITQITFVNGIIGIKENRETVLGIPKSEFKSKHKSGEPIVILRDMYAKEED